MKVEIISATEQDPVAAAALLIFTKHTRLQMDPSGYAEMYRKCRDDNDWMVTELDYMSKTIKSSWEFLDITFSIQGVSRACAQQITRTRFTPIDGDIFGSYAMQSQRVTDMSGAGFHVPEDPAGTMGYEKAMFAAIEDYQQLVDDGMKLENARGVLPINLQCNLIAKYNFRMLTDLVKARTSGRAQSEFQELANQLYQSVIDMWPWAELFFRSNNDTATSLIKDINEVLAAHSDAIPEHVFNDLKTLVSKVRDQLI